jgi:hypothetical protein
MLCPENLAEELTPYPLPTKDGGVPRTIDDARAHMMVLPKKRAPRLTGNTPVGYSCNKPAWQH